MSNFRNRFVIKINRGHGATEFTVYSTDGNLRELSNRIKQLADGQNAIHSDYATFANRQTDNVRLTFVKSSDEELEILHNCRTWETIRWIIFSIAILIITCLSIYYIFALFN